MHWILPFFICHWYSIIVLTMYDELLMVKCYLRFCAILSIDKWQSNVAGCFIHQFSWPLACKLQKLFYVAFCDCAKLFVEGSIHSVLFFGLSLAIVLIDNFSSIQIHVYVSLMYWGCDIFRQYIYCLAQCDNCVCTNIETLHFFPFLKFH